MPLRNRVTPAGELIVTAHRGTLMGNRGVLHNADRVIVRHAQVRRWITCRLEFRGRHREVLTPRRYTELFFLDEAVSLAAGHRPCAECRYADYQAFRRCWTAARHLPEPPYADELDRVLQVERRLAGNQRQTWHSRLTDLPDGVFIVWRDQFWLLRAETLLRWTPAGYTDREPAFPGAAAVLTPRSTVAAIAAGYPPAVHPSAVAPLGKSLLSPPPG